MSASSPNKKRQHFDLVGDNDCEPISAKKVLSPADVVSSGCCDDVSCSAVNGSQPDVHVTSSDHRAWTMPKVGRLCSVDDMPHPQNGYVLVTWVEQSSSNVYPYSHAQYMIPSHEIDAAQWQDLVAANNVISEPADRFENFTVEEARLLCDLIDERVPAFLRTMRQHRLPDGAIVSASSLIKAFIIAGIISE